VETSARIADAVGSLVRAGYPATFVFVFDEVWLLAERVRSRVSALLQRPFVLVGDVWAWRIEPGRGRGWAPHRGVATHTFDRSEPEVINTWVALSDVEANRSCMHFVPLDEDPGYPEAMHRCDAPLERTCAVPASAGTALLWNANVLHWGGGCS